MKTTKKDKNSTKTVQKKEKREIKQKSSSVVNKQNKELQELERTWDEDLCE